MEPNQIIFPFMLHGVAIHLIVAYYLERLNLISSTFFGLFF